MSDRANLVRVLTASTGTSTMTLGAAYSQLFMTPAEANMVDGRPYTYLLVDGNNWELGKGVYTASGATLSRVTVLASRISGTLGKTKITLSGTAQVRIIESADDMGALRGTRAVTGTSDTLAQTDLGRAVTYSNASAIAVSLAQAGGSSQFLDGWSTWIKNTGAGTVTITPATSTINGGATLVLAQNLGAFIWSDGTNYHAYIIPLTRPLLAANNLADVPVPTTALNNIGGVNYSAAQSLTSAQQAQARANISAALKGQIFGLTISNNTTDAINNIDIAAGEAASTETNPILMVLASGLTKRLDANWAAGTNQGMRNSAAAITDTTYHIYLVSQANGANPDIYAHTNANASTVLAALQAETGGSAYISARRIASIVRSGGTIRAFRQTGDIFKLVSPMLDRDSTAAAADALLTISIPAGIRVRPFILISHQQGTAGDSYIQVGDGDAPAIAELVARTAIASQQQISANNTLISNTASQIRFAATIPSGTISNSQLRTLGWVDTRDRQ